MIWSWLFVHWPIPLGGSNSRSFKLWCWLLRKSVDYKIRRSQRLFPDAT